MREAKRLSPLAIGKLSKPGRYAIGDGCYLQISAGGSKSWLFRYTRNGQARQMGLGPFSLVPVGEARDKAKAARKALLDGADPIDAKRQGKARKRLEEAKRISFRTGAERMISSHEAAWQNAKHRQQWTSTLTSYAYPIIGELPIGEVDTSLVLKVLEPIWTAKPETASRVRGRIEAVLDWAKARGDRVGENPARWRGHLDKLLPKQSKVRRVKNHPAMPYVDLPKFMGELRGRNSISARALEFAILTAARTGEVIRAEWKEIDLDGGMWTIPAERMKAKKEHRVALSPRAVKILSSLPRSGEHVFPGARAGKPLSNMALLELMRGMAPDYVPHGFRSTFRDWAAEQTDYASEVVEMALAHAISSKVEAAYRRGDLFEKRRVLMQHWDAFTSREPFDAR